MARQESGATQRTTQAFDYVVVGGGTAGCVMAARLSERSNCRVLLIEAGQDTPPHAMPADILDTWPTSYVNPAYRWQLNGHALSAHDCPEAPLLHARVMGGGSSIMGMVMLRGCPIDYDRWAELGADGWSWNDVLPWFRRLENDLDFTGPLHGQSGPTEIRRHDPAGWPALSRAGLDFAAARSLPFVDDLNGDFRDGYGPMPIAGTIERRATSAAAYLTAEVRARPNLAIMSDTLVESLLWEGGRVAGVRVVTRDGAHDVSAVETILTMGALLTPHFMLAQGIGASEALAAAGVTVRHDLPGVGRNLQNHSALTIAAHLKSSARQRRPQRNHNNGMIRYSSREPGCGASDMAVMFGTRVTWHAIAARVANFGVVVMAPASRGKVTLRGGGASAAPRIEYNLLGDVRDLRRLAKGVDFLADLVGMLEDKGMIGTAVPISRFGAASTFGRPNLRNRIATDMIAAMADLAPAFGDSLVRSLGNAGLGWSDIVGDPASREAFIRTNITPLGHHAGSCRMGRADDAEAVVDAAGRVHRLPGLRVADASVMPTVPRANTNLPVLMIAEKIAGAIAAGN